MVPKPNPHLLCQSQHLLAQICAEIEQKHAITFARYMELALYTPELGYYHSNLEKFGEQGDFVTAPELSPLFAQCLARQCQQVLTMLSADEGVILEFGAGSGVMAETLLNELASLQCLPAHYYILEISPALRQRQKRYLAEKIPQWYSRITWLTELPPTMIQGVIIANEVVDAMPVHKFRIKNGKLHEYHVTFEQGSLQWHLDSPTPLLAEQVNALNINNYADYTSEINLELPKWLSGLAAILQSGLALIIDYGFPQQEYYHVQRDQGTIMCHFQHYAHSDPLIIPGIQDITAHVDFTALAMHAEANGLNVSGFTHQAGFLLNCGITELLPAEANIQTHYQLSQQIKRLTLPSEMGELCKVVALTKNYTEPLLGFQQFNQLVRL